MTDDVPSIVRRMNDAQRAAVLGWLQVYIDPNTLRALRRRGLVFRTKLTPLGLRVRDALLSHEPERKSP